MTTGNFRIAILRNSTQVIYDWKENVPGVPITAGFINDIVLKKRISTAVIAKDKTMDYELEFLPKN